MATPPRVNRLQKENFDKDEQDLIESLAASLNPFMEQTRQAFEKRIDFNNLNQELISFTVTVDSGGVPVQDVQWRSKLTSQVAGAYVISAISTPTTFPTGAPFLTFNQSNEIVTVQHITGLPVGVKYKLTVLSIGK